MEQKEQIAQTTSFTMFSCGPPAEVAETIGFTVFLEHDIKKQMILICFVEPRVIKPVVLLWCFCRIPTEVAETISFTMRLGPGIQRTPFFISFEQLGSISHNLRTTKSGPDHAHTHPQEAI